MSLAVLNIGNSHDGSLRGEPIAGDAVVCQAGKIAWIGNSTDVSPSDFETVLDAAGAILIPGLVDSHVHSTFADYTPRQKTIDFLESYVHGGTTRVYSASEVHVPGRPSDRIGVMALAIAAQRSFEHFRPGGMAVHGGSVILEPGLTLEDFRTLAFHGVRMAKAGFGAFEMARDYVPVVQAAKEAGLVVMCHTGGGSIPGSQSKISAELLLEMRPHIAGHVNGGPTALTNEENRLIVDEGEGIALQLVHAGNLRSAVDISERALERGDLKRLLIATDTPTGTGVIPLGMLRSMAELVSVGPLSPREAITAATGNPTAIYGTEGGRLAVGKAADLVLVNTPLGSTASDAFETLERGDLPAVSCVVTDGNIRLVRSRNTPPPVVPVELLRVSKYV